MLLVRKQIGVQLDEGLAEPALADADAGSRRIEAERVISRGDDIGQAFVIRARQSGFDGRLIAEALAAAIDVFASIENDGDRQPLFGCAQRPEIAGTPLDRCSLDCAIAFACAAVEAACCGGRRLASASAVGRRLVLELVRR